MEPPLSTDAARRVLVVEDDGESGPRSRTACLAKFS